MTTTEKTERRKAQLKAAQERYRLRHPDKVRARQAAWAKANPDKIRAKRERHTAKHRERLLAEKRAKRKAERLANPEKVRAYMRDYYARNREACKERSRRYYKKDCEKWKARVRKYRKNNHEKCLECERKWKKAHPDAWKRWSKANPGAAANIRNRRRARKANAPVNDFTVKQWNELKESFGHRCAYCNKYCPRELTQDHVVPISKGGSHTLSNIVPACRWCNTSKGNRSKPNPRPRRA